MKDCPQAPQPEAGIAELAGSGRGGEIALFLP